LKGHLDAMLLAVLEAGPLHGYAIAEQLRTRSGGAFDLPSGTIYPALHRLELSGYLEGLWSEIGGRRRRSYQLTERGRAALAEERQSWHGFSTAVGALLGAEA
jgi:PadR family transcriptional regulator